MNTPTHGCGHAARSLAGKPIAVKLDRFGKPAKLALKCAACRGRDRGRPENLTGTRAVEGGK